jgi:hypothetical protein
MISDRHWLVSVTHSSCRFGSEVNWLNADCDSLLNQAKERMESVSLVSQAADCVLFYFLAGLKLY